MRWRLVLCSSRLAVVGAVLLRRVVYAGIVLAIVALALLAPAFVLGAAPVLALVVVLSAGWFPGEAAIARLRHGCRRSGVPRGAPVRALRDLRFARRVSRRLICFSLANRPPPLSLSA